MKIAFLTTISRKLSGKIIDSEPVGGTHSAMINLASELAKSNHEVFVFSNCLGEEGIYSNVKYLMSNKIIRFTKENDIDILICVASESALKANIKTKKTILWLHNDYSPYWNHELSDIASQISEYMTVKCDKVVTVSKWQSDIVKKTFLIPENHIKIIANGINSELFDDHEHGKIIRTEKRLIYTTSPDRGLDLLLKFFPEIRKKVPDVELHIYSSFKTWGKNDSSYIEIEKEIFKNTDQEGIFLHDPLPIKQLIKELKKSSIFTYPNHQGDETYFFAETFSLSALEAQAVGLPIITSNRGALIDRVINHRTGFIIDEDPYSTEYKNKFISSVIKLLTDKKLWQEYSNNSKLESEKFSYKYLVKEWEVLFEKLLNEKFSTRLSQAPLKPLFPTPKISIIIPTYNRADNLSYCLNALTKQNFKQFEVIIADDGSTDNTKQVVDNFRDLLNIRYAFCGENKGFRAARTRNMGLKKARGKLIVFLDSDIIVPSSYLDEHVKAHQKYHELIVNSFVYRMKEYKEDDLGLPPDQYIKKHKDNLNNDIKHEFNVFDREEPIEEGYFLDSNSLSIKAEHIIKEGFDPSFVGWGHEDTELGYRFSHKFFRFSFIKNNCESYHIYHYVSPEKDAETKVNWKRLTTKYQLKKWYTPLPKLEVEGAIILDNIDLEKSFLLSNNVEAKFEINIGDKFIGFEPFLNVDLS